MGFENIKTDNKNRDEEKAKIDSALAQYFDYWEYPDENRKGQYGKYLDAMLTYVKQQKDIFDDYFFKLSWDKHENVWYANGYQYIEIQIRKVRDFKDDKKIIDYILDLKLRNNKLIKRFSIYVISDFEKIESYTTDDTSFKTKYKLTGYGSHEDVIGKIEHNNQLNGNYQFKLQVDYDMQNPNEHDDKIVTYDSMEKLIKDIGNRFFNE